MFPRMDLIRQKTATMGCPGMGLIKGVLTTLLAGLLLSGCGGAKQAPSIYPQMDDPMLFRTSNRVSGPLKQVMGPLPIRFGQTRNPLVRVVVYGAPSSAYSAEFFNSTLPAIPGLGSGGTVAVVYRSVVDTEADRSAAVMVHCLPDKSRRGDFIKSIMSEAATMTTDAERQAMIIKQGRAYGVNRSRYARCAANPLLQEWIAIVQREAQETLRISKLPTLFINGKKLTGPVKEAVLSEIQLALNAS